MTVSLEVRSLSKLSFSRPPPVSSSPFSSVSLFYSFVVSPRLSLFLSRSSPQRAPDWRVVQGWKARRRGIQKQTTQKIYMRGRGKTPLHEHTRAHTQTQRSPKDYHRHDTGHFREDSICSLPYLIPQKRTLCSQETSHFLFETDTAVWTHIIICELHISAVQEAIERFPSVQVHSHWD